MATITASVASGYIYLAANGKSTSFHASDFGGIGKWVYENAREQRKPAEPNTVDVIARKLEEDKRKRAKS